MLILDIFGRSKKDRFIFNNNIKNNFSTANMEIDIDHIPHYIARLAVESSPAQWTTLVLVSRHLWSYAELDACFYTDGTETAVLIDINDDDLPEEDTVLGKFETLRKHMYNENPERGAWYTCVLSIQHDGNFECTFDYVHKPDWDEQPLEEDYLEDLRYFPRKANALPEWLSSIIHAIDVYPLPNE